MPKVLILTGDAGESLEVLYPYQRLREEGYDVEIAAPTKKRLQFVVHDFVEGFDTYTEKLGYTWPADLAFSEVDPSDYVALVVPGGRAPEYIRNDPDFARIARHFFEEELPVAQLCHAPQALGIGEETVVVERGHVDRAKPEPDLFLTCAERLGVSAADCYIVGDAVWDLLAARRAGMLSVGLLSGGYGEDELTRAGAFRVYRDAAELRASLDEIGVLSW